MAEADEVGPHVLDEGQLAPDEIVGEGGAETGVILVAVGPAQEQPLAVEEEGSLLLPLDVAQAEVLADLLLALGALVADLAGVERRVRGRPQRRRVDLEAEQR